MASQTGPLKPGPLSYKLNPAYVKSLIRAYNREVSSLPHVIASRAVMSELYDHQKEILTSKKKRIAVCTPRQVGKTYMVSRALFYNAVLGLSSKAFVVYLTDTRQHAKDLVWGELLSLFSRHNIDVDINATFLTITCTHNGVTIKLVGADDDREARKLRGYQFGLFVVDEAQSLSDDFLLKLTKEHIPAGLAAFNAPLWLVGTPGPTRSGLFFQVTESPDKYGWQKFSWDQFGNPKFPRWAGKPNWEQEVVRFLDDMSAEYALGKNDPAFRREYMGQWAVDVERYCYSLDSNVNHMPPSLHLDNLPKVIGVDLGYHDAAAYVVCAYSSVDGEVYVIEASQTKKSLVHEIAESICDLVDRYEPERIVMDTAGGSKIVVESIAEEVSYRYSIPVTPAEKTRKAAFMRLLDSDLRRGKVRLPAGELWDQLVTLRKDPKRGIENPSDPCDLADAFLYAYRDCQHYISAPTLPPPSLPPHELHRVYAHRTVEDPGSEDLMEYLLS